MAKNDNVKDMFYNIIDYVVMLAIIIGVVLLLGSKFEILFNKNTNDEPEKNNTNLVTEKDVNPDESDITDNNIEDVNENDENSETETEVEPNENTENSENTDVENSETETVDPNENTENNENGESNNNQNVNHDEQSNPATGEEVTVTIPASALPGQVGQILADNGLVESAEAFVNKTVELGLDRVLKSGQFTIKKGTPLDTIVKIIAKKI